MVKSQTLPTDVPNKLELWWASYKEMSIIEKKIWPEMFENDKELPVDFRLADLELVAGDKIRFREWDQKTKQYSGREYTKSVKRVTKHNSPTKYWPSEDLERHGMYIIEFE